MTFPSTTGSKTIKTVSALDFTPYTSFWDCVESIVSVNMRFRVKKSWIVF